LEWPEDAEASADGSHCKVADVVASELEGTVVADSGLGIWREGGETIDLLEDGEVGMGMVDGFKAAEGLVVLIEASNFSSTVLLVVGMASLPMLLTSLGQWRSRKSKMTLAYGQTPPHPQHPGD
jgi:hypothetical protein